MVVNSNPTTSLKLVVFDLDYTIWQPEMYQLYGAPRLRPIDAFVGSLSPDLLQEATTIQEGYILTDQENSPMRVFPGA